jgi:hypothetical protein
MADDIDEDLPSKLPRLTIQNGILSVDDSSINHRKSFTTEMNRRSPRKPDPRSNGKSFIPFQKYQNGTSTAKRYFENVLVITAFGVDNMTHGNLLRSGDYANLSRIALYDSDYVFKVFEHFPSTMASARTADGSDRPRISNLVSNSDAWRHHYDGGIFIEEMVRCDSSKTRLYLSTPSKWYNLSLLIFRFKYLCANIFYRMIRFHCAFHSCDS